MKNKSKNILTIISVLLLVISAFGIYLNEPFTIYIQLLLLLLSLLLRLKNLFEIEAIKKEFESGSIDFLKNCIQIVAFLCAGAYFLYQVVGNVDITNLNIELATDRVSLNKDSDYLSINVKLNKGAMASVHLHDIKGYLYADNSAKPVDSLEFNGIQRVKIVTYKKNGSEKYTTYNEEDKSEKYRIAAGEATQFATYRKIGKKSAYVVEIIVITERRKLLHSVTSQFKASTVSLPKVNDSAMPKKIYNF
jgi:hypothetical protein